MLVEDLAAMVGFNTVSSRPVAPLSEWLANRLHDLGFSIRLVADPHTAGKHNLVAAIGPTGTDGLVLTGHMDVVPTEGQPWTSDPFTLRIDGDRLFGRGTADMKGFFAATLEALRRLPLDRLDRELLLLWTYDEEVGCLGSAHLVDTFLNEDRPVPTACLVGEPTDFTLLRMHPGHEAWRVTLTGRAAHSSRPDLGVNAIEGAAEVVAELRTIAAELRAQPVALPGLDPNVVAVNVGVIRGGTAVNVVPDRCTVDFGYRPLPGQPADAVGRLLQRRLAQVGRPWTCEVAPLHGIRALHTQPATPLQTLLRAYAVPSDTESASFATDGGNLARLGTHPIVFGPGSIEVAHKADEFVQRSALERAATVLEAVIRARCFDA